MKTPPNGWSGRPGRWAGEGRYRFSVARIVAEVGLFLGTEGDLDVVAVGVADVNLAPFRTNPNPFHLL